MIRKIPAIAAVCMLFGALFSADRIAIAEPAAKGGVTPQEIETFWACWRVRWTAVTSLFRVRR
ncbi:MAG: hypothetical protein V8T86_01040 [Victivallis sp.]